ncbi:Kelch repeat-containing protein [Deinococcus koreensis]|uniref:Kelch repeat-containing protein n=1 Tax=Deinococcus koreensis TaxID=2054903 RepID=UPI0013FD1F7A|nr:kelch repeat-containing protein [Deinococcus koreensis]
MSTPTPRRRPGLPALARLVGLGALLSLAAAACDQPAGPDDRPAQIELQPAALVFSSVQTRPSAAQRLTLSNPGQTALRLTTLSLGGPNAGDFELLAPPALPLEIGAGGQVEFQARLLAGTQPGVLRASLEAAGAGEPRQLSLSGLRATGLEGTNEPPLAQIVDALNYRIDVGSPALELGTGSVLLGEEIRAPLFRRAGTGPVRLRPVARYSPDGPAPFGFFTLDGPSGGARLKELGTIPAGEHQTLHPAVTASTRLDFDPGDQPFGVYLAPNAYAPQGTFTLDSLNGGPTRRGVRVYPVRDRAGEVVADTYLLGLEPAANGDYQDAVFLLEQAQPVPAVLGWGARGAAPTTLYEGQGAAVGGRLYVFGGFDRNLDGVPTATRAAWRFDASDNRWAALKPAPQALTHAGTAVDGASIYVAGGFLGDHPGPETDQVWRYDTAADSWTALPPLPSPRGAGALVRLGRDLHFFGGVRRTPDGEYRDDNAQHWVLPLDGGSWREAAPLPNARNHLAGVALGGRIYAIGGQHGGNEARDNQSDVHAYDPATDAWTAVSPLPLPLSHIAASTTVWRGQIVVVGGVTNASGSGAFEGREMETVLAYDPRSNRWSRLQPLPAPRQSSVADVIGDALVVSTGSTSAGPTDTTWQGN